MKLTPIKYYLINAIIFLILVGSMAIAYNPKPKLLILHSYNTDYNWVLQMNEGIQRLTKLHDLKIRYHYMDLKNNFTPKDKLKAISMAKGLIDSYSPDVMIIADDAAQELIGKLYVNHEHTNIVFCSVNGEVDKYGYDKAWNVTGIYERKPLKAIQETLVMLAKNKSIDYSVNNKMAKIVWLTDMSDSVTQEIEQLEKYDWFPLYWLPPLRANNFKVWKQNVMTANDISDLIMVSDYREFKNPDGSKEKVKPSEIISWTEENSKVPVLGMSLINVYDGGSFSVFNSGYEQGEVAASMALEIINGKLPKDIERVVSSQFITSVRESAIGQKNFPKIPDIYKAFSKATGNSYKEN